MRRPFFGTVDQLEEHRVGDVKSSELVEGTWGHENFAAVVGRLSIWTGKHGDGIASILLIKDLTMTGKSLAHGWGEHVHGIIFVVVHGVELSGVRISELGTVTRLSELTMMAG